MNRPVRLTIALLSIFFSPALVARADPCGNGVINAGEDCDQSNLHGATCLSLGFKGGHLACGGGCVFDTSGCWHAQFKDNADGTISDRQTGLMWEKKASCDGSQNPADRHDADNLFSWAGFCLLEPSKMCQPTERAAAACAAGVRNSSAGCAECIEGTPCITPENGTPWTWLVGLNDDNFAGHSDWRIPTAEELDTIIDRTVSAASATPLAFRTAACTATPGTACTDITDAACSSTTKKFGFYQSATSFRGAGRFVIQAQFSAGGEFIADPKQFEFKDIGPPREAVRAVRGGP
jgi:uncharacterized protein DUF1566